MSRSYVSAPVRVVLTCLGLLTAVLVPGLAAANPGQSCGHWIPDAAARAGVPRAALYAIAAIETGDPAAQRDSSWPWSVHAEGRGHRFATRDDAVAYVQTQLAAGRTNVDIGCFQLNYRWHGMAFATLHDMFEPRRNAHYAARFLRKLHDETGSWTQAAGAYHSRTETHATAYIDKWHHALRVQGRPHPDSAPRIAGKMPGITPQPTGYPLLRLTAAKPARLGSLFPPDLRRASAAPIVQQEIN